MQIMTVMNRPSAAARSSSPVKLYSSSRIFYDAFHNKELTQKAFETVNLFLNVAPEGGRFKVSAFAKNVTNTHYIVSTSASSGSGTVRGFYSDPRTLGIQASFNY